MHKLAKAGIAGVIGTSLLLGGAGSFALWNTSVNVPLHSISTGNLALAANSDGVWKNGNTTIDPAVFRMVPGDTLTYTQSLQVTAIGDDLKASLSYSGIQSSGTLKDLVTSSLAVTSSSTNLTANGGTISVVGASAPATALVTLTISLPSTTTTGQSGELDLSGFAFTLTQTA